MVSEPGAVVEGERRLGVHHGTRRRRRRRATARQALAGGDGLEDLIRRGRRPGSSWVMSNMCGAYRSAAIVGFRRTRRRVTRRCRTPSVGSRHGRRSDRCSGAASAERPAPSGPGGARRAASGTPWSRRSTPPTCRPCAWPVPAAAPGTRPCPSPRSTRRRRRPWRPGIDEVDRVLSGGLVPGLGHPRRRRAGHRQVDPAAPGGRRARGAGRQRRCTSRPRSPSSRCGCGPTGWARCGPTLYLAAENAVPHIVAHIDTVSPDVVVVDSIQTVFDPQVTSAPGSVAQVRESRGPTRARGQDPGRRGDPRRSRHQGRQPRRPTGARARRRHRAVVRGRSPPRPAAAAGGQAPVRLHRRARACSRCPSTGCCRSPTPAPCSWPIVAAACPARPWCPPSRATARCWSSCRRWSTRRRSPRPDARRRASTAVGSSLLTAVLDRRVGLSVAGYDVYALAVGGVRVVEPAADLALCLAIASSLTDVALPATMVACGEVGLGGEIRQVGQLDRRLDEAARLGFTQALVPLLAPEPPAGHRGHPGRHPGRGGRPDGHRRARHAPGRSRPGRALSRRRRGAAPTPSSTAPRRRGTGTRATFVRQSEQRRARSERAATTPPTHPRSDAL